LYTEHWSFGNTFVEVLGHLGSHWMTTS